MEITTLALDAVGLKVIDLCACGVKCVVPRVDRLSIVSLSVRLGHKPYLVSGCGSCQGRLTGRYDTCSLRPISRLWLSHGPSLSNGRHAPSVKQIYPVLGGRYLLVNGPFLSGKEVNVLLLRSLLILDEKLLLGHLLVSLLL